MSNNISNAFVWQMMDILFCYECIVSQNVSFCLLEFARL